MQLSEDSRIDLIEKLILSLESHREIETEQIAVAAKRLAQLQSGEARSVALDDAISRIQASLAARRSA